VNPYELLRGGWDDAPGRDVVRPALAQLRQRHRRRLGALGALVLLAAGCLGAAAVTGDGGGRVGLAPAGPTQAATLAPAPPSAPAPTGPPAATSYDARAHLVAISQPGRLLLVEPGSGASRQVLTPGQTPLDPLWSVDGSRVAFRLGVVEHVADRDGTGDHVVGSTRSVGDANVAEWDPAGSHRLVILGSRSLTVIDVDTGSQHLLVAGTGYALRWSPDGRHLAAVLDERLVVVDPTTGAATALTPDPCASPTAWTADSSRLLYWSGQGCSASLGTDGAELFSVQADGGGTRDLGVVTLRYPEWVQATTGTRVLVVVGGDRSAYVGKHPALVDAATGAISALPQPAGTVTVDPAVRGGVVRVAVRAPQHTGPDLVVPRTLVYPLGGQRELSPEPSYAPDGRLPTDVADPQVSDPADDLEMVFLAAGEVWSSGHYEGAAGSRPLAAYDQGAAVPVYGHVDAAGVLAWWRS